MRNTKTKIQEKKVLRHKSVPHGQKYATFEYARTTRYVSGLLWARAQYARSEHAFKKTWRIRKEHATRDKQRKKCATDCTQIKRVIWKREENSTDRACLVHMKSNGLYLREEGERYFYVEINLYFIVHTVI
jgi:hypothetical protein